METPGIIADALSAFQSHKSLADRAVAQLSDEQLRVALHPETNSIAVIMKHVAGNLISRWTDPLTTDGEKPWRDRDQEFVDAFRSRAEILETWERGFDRLFDTLRSFSADDLGRIITIRGEPQTVSLALQRSLGHTCYHVGQIVLIARVLAGDNWQVLTIPRGGSAAYNAQLQSPPPKQTGG